MNPNTEFNTVPHGASTASRMDAQSYDVAVYDVVVIGGGFAGTASALLLKRWLGDVRILVLERGEKFERKVGEATVEVSGHFLHNVLGLYDHLSRHHLPKHGLRFWFSDGQDRPLHELSEVGPKSLPDTPSFQLDRPVLDQHLLDTARDEGCEVLRPAKVTAVDHGWPKSQVTYRMAGQEHAVETRWVIDASGRQSFLARKLGLRVEMPEHPTAAMWGRWHGAADLDSTQLQGADPRQHALQSVTASRRLATNHFFDYGWWSWVIPLASGQTSIGVVYNKELHQPGDGTLRERYERHVRSTPGLSRLVAGAHLDDRDFMALQSLPYTSERYMDRGWALVGDSASFLDPFYSPGLDHAAISIYATARLIEKDLRREIDDQALGEHIEAHNVDFTVSIKRWYEALYENKYELMGDAQLLSCAYLFDTALYYAGVVTSVCRDPDAMGRPLFSPTVPQGSYAHRTMRGINRRLVKLARNRRRAGIYGRDNLRSSHLGVPFTLGWGASLPYLRQATAIWLRLEWQNLRHRGRGSREEAMPEPVAS